ncbi:hypothetical protein ABT039_22885 [Streptomyces lasiicapitis]|uniref:hypothetical protein n=1 Tax=Streptomyces lasiicapitis TaxID=1923961 RepID=UPI003329772A
MTTVRKLYATATAVLLTVAAAITFSVTSAPQDRDVRADPHWSTTPPAPSLAESPAPDPAPQDGDDPHWIQDPHWG